ncbi:MULTISPECIES: PTS system mannose/fructose/sorbose family transporter subunit IID [unclassified Peribacillus]|uniref:PTS system mannose/fructose/sorbose family transporter subunit IID n=1 Tax=unclassified Peribacillus TaxID=2675266 RepID=UPI001F4DE1F6|nr:MULTISPECIES: PTS system mannose/fructose/sorbose family transporter subunit IID [unclassified Peribacillus]MCK1986043.1 PTS system mannose/fructose/sorbose family transporter subunit IID [Peribacillus sp. Aquil_B1]MCK2011341.1 PTS system mannose/fructose/sorbose family transporter subunit IID [Peribacillus sp. Aquil_B8]
MTKTSKTLTKSDIRKSVLRALSLEFSFNYERQQSLGFAFAMIPILKKLYSKKEDMEKALKRHLEFFNTTPYVSPLILGIMGAMEEQNAKDKQFDESSINSVKASLMGPLAGIGDSLYWGTLRLIATGIGTSLALNGNLLGPILFFLIFNIPMLALFFSYMTMGHKLGTGFISKLQKTGAMGKLTYGASILGLLVIGGMSASMINIYVPWEIGSGDSATSIQSVLDSIMPGLLPLWAFWIIYWLLGRNVKTTTILLGIFVLGIVAAGLNILSIAQ